MSQEKGSPTLLPEFSGLALFFALLVTFNYPLSLWVKTFAQKSSLCHFDLGSGPSGVPEQCLYLLMLPRPPEIIKWFVSLGSLHPTVPHVCVAFSNFPLYKIWSCLITINQRRDHSLEEKSGAASVSTSGAHSGRSDDNF